MSNIWIDIYVGEIYYDEEDGRIEKPDYSQRVELLFTRDLDGNTIIVFRSDLHKMVDSALNKIQSDMEQRYRDTERNIHIISRDDAFKLAKEMGGSGTPEELEEE